MVIAIIAVLAAMLLPALSRAKAKGQQLACLNNYRQLQLCWHMYVEDANDNLPPNSTVSGGGRAAFAAPTNTWVNGSAYTDTTTSNIQAGLLFPYNKSVAIYKCPSDRSTVRDQGKIQRVRSVSMSDYMNDVPNPADHSCWHKYSSIRSPPPVRAFVFIDEHENSIENARFVSTQPGVWRWVDFPAVRHANAGVLSFADGHCELWKWRELRTIQAGRFPPWIQNVTTRVGDLDITRIHRAIPVIPIR